MNSIMSGAPRHHLIPILSLAGVMLDALGGLYLAYDLLGGKKGPLRIVTKSVSYGVMFGSVYGLPLGAWFGLVGLLISGPALNIEIGRREVRRAHPVFEALSFGLLRAVSFGTAGWLSKDSQFGINFGIFCAVGFVAAYLIVGPPTQTSLGRPRIDKRTEAGCFPWYVDWFGCGTERCASQRASCAFVWRRGRSGYWDIEWYSGRGSACGGSLG